jgi:hypothetical protein
VLAQAIIVLRSLRPVGDVWVVEFADLEESHGA